MRIDTAYDREYATCSYTHIWLRIMHESLDPNDITNFVGVQPTRTQLAGTRRSEKSSHVRKYSGWFLESSDYVDSLDARHHIDWLLEKIGDKSACFTELKNRGYLVDICCRWDSQSGQGGPALTPEEMSKLGVLGVELWFDLYFDDRNADA